MQFSAILTSLALAASLLMPAATPVYAQGRTNDHFDSIIADMEQAYRARDRQRLSALRPQVEGYILEPWAAYWELSARLDEAGPTEIREFFTRYAGTYQEDRLRVDLLMQLGRNRDWAGFSREFDKYRMGDDKSIRCYRLLADYQTSKADISSDLTSLWLPLKDSDEACAGAAQQLLGDHVLPTATVWLRARLGMEADRPRVVTQAVGLLDDALVKKVSALYQNPQRYLKDSPPALRPRYRELAVLALTRLAWQDPDQAASELSRSRWKNQFTSEERTWLWGAIGKRAAQKLSDDALRYFAQGQIADMQDDQLAWGARAALRAGNWGLVQKFIAAMPATTRSDVTWIYWRARADLMRSRSEAVRAQALQSLRNIAGIGGFYEQLALEETGQPITLPPSAAPLTPQEKDAARNNPGLQRAVYAIQIGLRSEGVREWNYTTNLHQPGGMDDRALLGAADLACRAGIWDRCISSSDRTRTQFAMDQRFPMPFESLVLQQAGKVGVDPAYVYGLIRQESRFVTDARSSVGASGLMQVMPATARWTARKLGLTDFQAGQLGNGDTNLAIGTGYLKLLLDSFNGSMPLATAAYNAGPARARAWRNADGDTPLDAAVWTENIPFSETRDYVKKVLVNTTLYAALITGQSQSIKSRLGTVQPRDPVRPDTSPELP